MILSALFILAAIMVAADTILTIMYSDRQGYIKKDNELALALKKALLYSSVVVWIGILICLIIR